MTLHFSVAELDSYRNRDCRFRKHCLCRLHLLFCRNCRASLKELQVCDDFLASIKKLVREKGV